MTRHMKTLCNLKEKMEEIIFRNEEKIYDILEERLDDVNLYFKIQKSFATGCLDSLFEERFKRFYRMNTAGLTPKHVRTQDDNPGSLSSQAR